MIGTITKFGTYLKASIIHSKVRSGLVLLEKVVNSELVF
jgi:hypothetical protein